LQPELLRDRLRNLFAEIDRVAKRFVAAIEERKRPRVGAVRNANDFPGGDRCQPGR
jgi:hypothetical protein